PTTTGISVLASAGNGTFTRTPISLAATPVDIANIGDVDGNTLEDYVVLDVDPGNPRLRIFEQITTGTGWQVGTSIATSADATSVNAGLVNGGAVTDAVVTMTETNQIGFHIGNNTGSNWAFEALDTEPLTGGPIDAVVGQLRSTGASSIVLA